MANPSKQLLSILHLGARYWPDARFYLRQRESIESVALCKETLIAAANEVGKDFQAAFICLTFFLAPWLYFPVKHFLRFEKLRKPGQPEWQVHTRRVVTTSVKEQHLGVLWGEIGRFIGTSKEPLLARDGGPLLVNSFEVRFAAESEVKKPYNYLIGQVADNPQAMAGHHAAYTLFVGDEASGLKDVYYERAQGWADKFLLFGNPEDCANFFRDGIKGGDLA